MTGAQLLEALQSVPEGEEIFIHDACGDHYIPVLVVRRIRAQVSENKLCAPWGGRELPEREITVIE